MDAEDGNPSSPASVPKRDEEEKHETNDVTQSPSRDPRLGDFLGANPQTERSKREAGETETTHRGFGHRSGSSSDGGEKGENNQDQQQVTMSDQAEASSACDKDSRNCHPSQLAELVWWKAVSSILRGKLDYSFVKSRLSEYWKNILRRNEEDPGRYFEISPFSAIVYMKHAPLVKNLKAKTRSLKKGVVDEVFESFCSAELRAEIVAKQGYKSPAGSRKSPKNKSASRNRASKGIEMSFNDISEYHTREGSETKRAPLHGTELFGREGKGSKYASPSQLAELAWWKEVSKILRGKHDYYWVKERLSDFWKNILRRNEEHPKRSFQVSPFNAIIHLNHRQIVKDLQDDAQESLRTGNIANIFQPFSTEGILHEVAMVQRLNRDSRKKKSSTSIVPLDRDDGKSSTSAQGGLGEREVVSLDYAKLGAGQKSGARFAKKSSQDLMSGAEATDTQLAELAWWRAASLILFAQHDYDWIEQKLSEFWKDTLRRNKQEPSRMFIVNPFAAVVFSEHRSHMKDLMEKAHKSLWTRKVEEVFLQFSSEELLEEIAGIVQWQVEQVESQTNASSTHHNIETSPAESPYKPYHGIYGHVYANWSQREEGAWTEGVVVGCKTQSNGMYGDVRTYDVRLEDDEIWFGLDEMWVEKAEDYLWREHAYPIVGVREVKVEDCDDNYMKRRGYYRVDDGTVYNSLVTAMRAHDVGLIEKEGPSIASDRLNFPQEWDLKPIVEIDDDSSDNESEAPCPVNISCLPPALLELAKVCASCPYEYRQAGPGEIPKLQAPMINWTAVYDKVSPTLREYLDEKSSEEGFAKTRAKKQRFVPVEYLDSFDGYFQHLCNEIGRNPPKGHDNAEARTNEALLTPLLKQLAQVCASCPLQLGDREHRVDWNAAYGKASPALRSYLDSKASEDGFKKTRLKKQRLVPPKKREAFDAYLSKLCKQSQVTRKKGGELVTNEELDVETTPKQDFSYESFGDECEMDLSEFTPELLELAWLCSSRHPYKKGGGSTWKRVQKEGSKDLNRYLDTIDGFHNAQHKMRLAVPVHLQEKFTAYRIFLYEKRFGRDEDKSGYADNEEVAATDECPVDTSQFSPELMEIAQLAASMDPKAKGPTASATWRIVYENGSSQLRSYLDSKSDTGRFFDLSRKNRAAVPRHLHESFSLYRKYMYEKHQRHSDEKKVDESAFDAIGHPYDSDDSANRDAEFIPEINWDSIATCPVDTSILTSEMLELAELLSMRNPKVSYNMHNSIWPKVIEMASPRLRRLMDSIPNFETKQYKEHELVPHRYRATFYAYRDFLQGQRYGPTAQSNGRKTDRQQHRDLKGGRKHDYGKQQDSTCPPETNVSQDDVKCDTKDDKRDEDEDDEDCPVDVSEFTPELMELVKLCSEYDPSLPGRSLRSFWSNVYNASSPESKRYIDSKAGFWTSKWKRDLIVPQRFIPAFREYKAYLLNKIKSRGAPAPRRVGTKRSAATDVDMPLGEVRPQKKRMTEDNFDGQNDLDDSATDDIDEIEELVTEEQQLTFEEEWHETKYDPRSWGFEKRSDQRWQRFCRAVRVQWTEVSGLDSETMNRCWPNFQRNHRRLWQEFLDGEAEEMLADCQGTMSSAERHFCQNGEKSISKRLERYINSVDCFIEFRKHRLETTLDWLYAQVEHFVAQPMSVQLFEWYLFWERVDMKCQEYRYLERCALEKHLLDCRKVLDRKVNL